MGELQWSIDNINMDKMLDVAKGHQYIGITANDDTWNSRFHNNYIPYNISIIGIYICNYDYLPYNASSCTIYLQRNMYVCNIPPLITIACYPTNYSPYMEYEHKNRHFYYSCFWCNCDNCEASCNYISIEGITIPYSDCIIVDIESLGPSDERAYRNTVRIK
jgi:hypothetical protein